VLTYSDVKVSVKDKKCPLSYCSEKIAKLNQLSTIAEDKARGDGTSHKELQAQIMTVGTRTRL